MTKNIKKLLLFHKYNWSHLCIDHWKQYIQIRITEKKATLLAFQRRFDPRSGKCILLIIKLTLTHTRTLTLTLTLFCLVLDRISF